jgi:hypothetical protein
MKLVNNCVIKLIETNYVSIGPLKAYISITFLFFLRSLLLSYHFPKKINGFKNRFKENKKTQKHKQILSSLYVYRLNVNCGVGDENVC